MLGLAPIVSRGVEHWAGRLTVHMANGMLGLEQVPLRKLCWDKPLGQHLGDMCVHSPST